MDDRVLEAANAAFEARLDRDFGDDWIASIVGNAVGDGIEVLGHPKGARANDDDIDAFLGLRLTARTIGYIQESVAGFVGDELREAIVADLGFEDVEGLASLLGPVEWLGGSDSSRFAVMVAGSIDVWIVRRNGHFATFESGDDSYDAGYLSERRAEADDPGLRRTRLAVAERFTGLAPGVRIADADDIDTELRDFTFTTSTWHDSYSDLLAADPERIEELVEKYETTYLAASDPEGTRERLRTVIRSGVFESDAERDLLWRVWKQLRNRWLPQ